MPCWGSASSAPVTSPAPAPRPGEELCGTGGQSYSNGETESESSTDLLGPYMGLKETHRVTTRAEPSGPVAEEASDTCLEFHQ